MKTKKLQTGSPNIECTVNVWSDEARAAALEARRSGSSGGGSNDSPADFHHGFAKGATKRAEEKSKAQGAPNGAYWRRAMRAHADAAKAHDERSKNASSDEERDTAQSRADYHRREMGRAKQQVDAAEKLPNGAYWR